MYYSRGQSGYAQSEGLKGKGKRKTEVGGLCEERFGWSGKGVENKSKG